MTYEQAKRQAIANAEYFKRPYYVVSTSMGFAAERDPPSAENADIATMAITMIEPPVTINEYVESMREMQNTIDELVAALRRYREVSHYILTHIDFRNLPEHLQRDAEQCDDQARAALKSIAAQSDKRAEE